MVKIDPDYPPSIAHRGFIISKCPNVSHGSTVIDVWVLRLYIDPRFVKYYKVRLLPNGTDLEVTMPVVDPSYWKDTTIWMNQERKRAHFSSDLEKGESVGRNGWTREEKQWQHTFILRFPERLTNATLAPGSINGLLKKHGDWYRVPYELKEDGIMKSANMTKFTLVWRVAKWEAKPRQHKIEDEDEEDFCDTFNSKLNM